MSPMLIHSSTSISAVHLCEQVHISHAKLVAGVVGEPFPRVSKIFHRPLVGLNHLGCPALPGCPYAYPIPCRHGRRSSRGRAYKITALAGDVVGQADALLVPAGPNPVKGRMHGH